MHSRTRFRGARSTFALDESSTLSVPARAEADAGASDAVRTAGAFRHGGGSAARRGPRSGSDRDTRRAFVRVSGRHQFLVSGLCNFLALGLHSPECESVRAMGSDPRQRGDLRICMVVGGLAAPA